MFTPYVGGPWSSVTYRNGQWHKCRGVCAETFLFIFVITVIDCVGPAQLLTMSRSRITHSVASDLSKGHYIGVFCITAYML